MTIRSYVYDAARGSDHEHEPRIEANSVHWEYPL